VEETDERGRKTRTTEARDNRRGIPQGSPISPLLANLYMRQGQKRTFTPIVSSCIAEQSLQSHAARDGCEAIEFAEAT
jgi:retron-type reverse transcriptase